MAHPVVWSLKYSLSPLLQDRFFRYFHDEERLLEPLVGAMAYPVIWSLNFPLFLCSGTDFSGICTSEVGYPRFLDWVMTHPVIPFLEYPPSPFIGQIFQVSARRRRVIYDFGLVCGKSSNLVSEIFTALLFCLDLMIYLRLCSCTKRGNFRCV